MSILKQIIDHKHEEIRRRKREFPESSLRKELQASEPGKLLKALQPEESNLGFIAEVKRKAPSSGELTRLSASHIAGVYDSVGVDAISVLTDEPFFGQTLEALREVRQVTKLPRLRKDFIIDEYQLWETVRTGAEGVLLIADLLDPIQLKDYYEMGKELGLDPLVEIHTREELESFRFQPEIVGINNRILDGDFTTDLGVTESLAPEVPEETVVISESGISSPEDVQRLGRVPEVGGLLVGTALTQGTTRAQEVLSNLEPLLEQAHGSEVSR